jgi:plasmid stabilization system protein ParE
MSRVRWTPKSKLDLADIKNHIQKDSKQNAIRFVKRIREAVHGTKIFPEAATRVFELEGVELREIYVGAYRVIFRIIDKELVVYRVIHGSRLIDRRLIQL